MWEMRSESAHGHCLKRATHGIRFSSAGPGSSQTALHYCGCPLLDWGWIALLVVRPHALNREVHTVQIRYECMYRATPNIHTMPINYTGTSQKFEISWKSWYKKILTFSRYSNCLRYLYIIFELPVYNKLSIILKSYFSCYKNSIFSS